MTIRHRTEKARGAGARSRPSAVAGLVATSGLAGAGALHALWASGSTWPAADAADLADLVVGRVPDARGGDGSSGAGAGGQPSMPGRGATAAVAVLLGSAAVLTAAASGLVPIPRGRTAQLARLGSRVASGVLLARGSGGLVASSFEIGAASERFHRWNLRLYSPLCLALGGAAGIAAREQR